MNVQLKRAPDVPERFADKAAFLEWMAVHEGRFELVGGKVVEMPGVSLDHWDLAHFVGVELRRQLPRRLWVIGSADFAVEIGEVVRFPDLMVVARGAHGKMSSTSEPILLVEILSPSSRAIDLGIKPLEYLTLASLRYYIVLDQDDPRAVVWAKRADGRFPDVPEVFVGRDVVIELPYFPAELSLAEVYGNAEGA